MSTYNTNADFMHQFELYAQNNSFEISLLLMLSENECVPSHVRQQWLRSFHSLARRLKIGSLQCTLRNTASLQQSLFRSRREFKKAAHFILSDLIPLIIDYEVQDDDLLDEILHVYHQRIEQHATNAHRSLFTLLGNIECILFVALSLLDLFHVLFPPQIYTTPIAAHYFPMRIWLISATLIILAIHLFVAIQTFHQRRVFCYYLQCLSPKVHTESAKYTAYTLEGFNICSLSDLLNTDYTEATQLKVATPNAISTYNLIVFSLKYIVGIAYCLCMLHQHVGLVVIAALPVILGAVCNLDSIHSTVYASLHADILRLYQQSDDRKDDTLSRSVSLHLRNARKQQQYKYLWQRVGYLSGYAALFTVAWPIVLLTPFFFGACVLCQVDPGIDGDWKGRQFARYWSAFMAIKVLAGLTFITLAELVISRSSFCCSSNSSNDHDRRDRNALDDVQADAYNTTIFAGMNCMSMAIIICLLAGLDSCVLHIFRMFAWCIVYLWLTTFTVKHIIPEHQRVVNWTAVIKLKWMFSSYLLQTKLG